MAKVGNWGSGIRFQTSDSRILTFMDMKRKASVRTAKHNIIYGKPKLEFLGPDLQTVTFKMELNALLGIRPRKEEEKLIRKMNAGYTAPLVIGGRKILGKAMITSLGSSYEHVLRKGEVFSMSIDGTMTEYR